MTNLERLRNLIGDSHKADLVRFFGDGTTESWLLPRKRIKTDSVVLGNTGGPTIDSVNYTTGLLTLTGAVADGTKFTVTLEYSAFTDEELESYLSSGSVKSAALEC